MTTSARKGLPQASRCRRVHLLLWWCASQHFRTDFVRTQARAVRQRISFLRRGACFRPLKSISTTQKRSRAQFECVQTLRKTSVTFAPPVQLTIDASFITTTFRLDFENCCTPTQHTPIAVHFTSRRELNRLQHALHGNPSKHSEGTRALVRKTRFEGKDEGHIRRYLKEQGICRSLIANCWLLVRRLLPPE